MRITKRTRRGSAMLEFALASAFLVPVVTGIFQFGYSFHIYNQLQESVSRGARYASRRAYSGSMSAEVKNIVVFGKPAPGPGDAPLIRGLSVNNVEVNAVMSGPVPSAITVKVVGFTLDSLFQKIELNHKPAVTFPYNG